MANSMRENNMKRARSAAPAQPWRWGVPIYSWLAPSTFSPVDKHGWIRDLDLPYEIVLLPGYERPASLERRDIDAIWYEQEVTEPLAVWDGERAVNLFEMISMCFDPRGEMSDFIKVREKKTGKFLDDPRPIEMLKDRPVRNYPGSIESMTRNAERKSFITEHLDPYYAKWGRKTGAWKAGEAFNVCYDRHDENASCHARSHWQRLMRMHPEVNDRFLLNIKPEKRQVVPGMKFGYALYEKAMEGKPEWYHGQLELEHLIEIGSATIKTAYQIASFKQSRGMPLNDEDAKALRKGGDYASKSLRGFFKKLGGIRRRA